MILAMRHMRAINALFCSQIKKQIICSFLGGTKLIQKDFTRNKIYLMFIFKYLLLNLPFHLFFCSNVFEKQIKENNFIVNYVDSIIRKIDASQ